MRSWNTGLRPLGVPLLFHPLSLILLVLLMPYGIAPAISMFAVLILSLVAHEYGHVFAAQKVGFQVICVETQIFGAVARIASPMTGHPHAELVTAIAGPLTSLALAVITLPFMLLGAPWILSWMSMINFVLAIFNLLPIFPMDGGRVLRALIAIRKGPRPATEAATFVTFVMAGFLAAAGFFFLHSIWIAIIMAFVISMAIAERNAVRDMYPRRYNKKRPPDTDPWMN